MCNCVSRLSTHRAVGAGKREDQTQTDTQQKEPELVAGPSQYGSLWPLPQKVHISDVSFKLSSSNFQITDAKESSAGPSCNLLQSAYRRYYEYVFVGPKNQKRGRDQPAGPSEVTELQVWITSPDSDCDSFPTESSDESYELSVDQPVAVLKAPKVWGALHGLETFSQLVYEDEFGAKTINSTVISDFPRFAHRGVLLDSSRHFIPVKVILANLETMAMNKFNIFHWHIVDDSSFPYLSQTFPQLSEKVRNRDGYRIRYFLRYRPNSIVPTEHRFTSFETVPRFGIHVTFPPPPPNRKSNPDIQKFMEQQGFGQDFTKLESFYIQRLLDIVTTTQKGYMIWQEVFDNGVKLKPDTLIHVWKGNQQSYQREMANITSAGYRTLLSSPWYLNRIAYGQDWQAIYKADPQDFKGTDDQKKLVIGGEACLWGEFVDATNLTPRLWPRACAVAERLWSAKEVTDTNDAFNRLAVHRCRLVERGIPAQPLYTSYCPREYKGI
uniref:Beta-hexosaminidase n=1 Tax=Nothobranchius furzeri TaxID=105023 RepID=A0A8C6P3G7_NOTFU